MVNNYVFVNGAEIYRLKASDSEKKNVSSLYCGNISKKFSLD